MNASIYNIKKGRESEEAKSMSSEKNKYRNQGSIV